MHMYVDCFLYHQKISSILQIYPLTFAGIAVNITYRYSAEHCEQEYDCNICRSPGRNGTCPPTYWNCTNQSCVQGREGVLCGKCSEGYAVAINDPDLACTKCNSPYYGVVIFLF